MRKGHIQDITFFYNKKTVFSILPNPYKPHEIKVFDTLTQYMLSYKGMHWNW